LSFSANCENVSTTIIRTSKVDSRYYEQMPNFLARHPAVSLRDQAWHANPSGIDDFVLPQ
ncbi:unnamed protein product, partial [Musa textilis]